MRGGVEPYPGADDDAWAIDTRLRRAGPCRRAIRPSAPCPPARRGLFGLVVRHLATGLRTHRLWQWSTPPRPSSCRSKPRPEDRPSATCGFRLALRSSTSPQRSSRAVRIDKTQLLLLGQERETGVVGDRSRHGDRGRAIRQRPQFLEMLGLSGGMPTRVSIPRSRLGELLKALGIAPDAFPA